MAQAEAAKVSKRAAEGKAAGRPASRKPGIGRAEILGKYWELANLDPEITKGTITGQLKALDSLCQELGLGRAEEDEGSPPQEIYRAAWLGKQPRAVEPQAAAQSPRGRAMPAEAASAPARASRVRSRPASEETRMKIDLR